MKKSTIAILVLLVLNLFIGLDNASALRNLVFYQRQEYQTQQVIPYQEPEVKGFYQGNKTRYIKFLSDMFYTLDNKRELIGTTVDNGEITAIFTYTKPINKKQMLYTIENTLKMIGKNAEVTEFDYVENINGKTIVIITFTEKY